VGLAFGRLRSIPVPQKEEKEIIQRKLINEEKTYFL
jgi:hypothetical protein